MYSHEPTVRACGCGPAWRPPLRRHSFALTCESSNAGGRTKSTGERAAGHRKGAGGRARRMLIRGSPQCQEVKTLPASTRGWLAGDAVGDEIAQVPGDTAVGVETRVEDSDLKAARSLTCQQAAQDCCSFLPGLPHCENWGVVQGCKVAHSHEPCRHSRRFRGQRRLPEVGLASA